MGARHKLHQRAEAPCGWRAENVQTRHRRFKPFLKDRITIEAVDGLEKLWSEKLVFGNVDSVSSSKKNMIDCSLASVIQADPYSLPNGCN